MRIIITAIIIFLAIYSVSHAEDFVIPEECEIVIDDFANGIKPDWTRKSFKGHTDYTWMKKNGRPFIRATSSNSASGLIYEIEYDPEKYPYIIWHWKIDKIIADGDATQKSKDDYSARIYAVFPSFLFWNTRSINYIWANKLPQGQAVPSSYTSNSIMVSVESGPGKTGSWITEIRNLYEDYQRFVGSKPPKVGAIAIMTDTDNTGESTSASYGPIAICSRDPRKK